jgi:hypothetical protein
MTEQYNQQRGVGAVLMCRIVSSCIDNWFEHECLFLAPAPAPAPAHLTRLSATCAGPNMADHAEPNAEPYAEDRRQEAESREEQGRLVRKKMHPKQRGAGSGPRPDSAAGHVLQVLYAQDDQGWVSIRQIISVVPDSTNAVRSAVSRMANVAASDNFADMYLQTRAFAGRAGEKEYCITAKGRDRVAKWM